MDAERLLLVFLAEVEGMTMGIDEPGRDQPAIEVDDMGLRLDVRCGAVIVAHVDDFVALDRNGFGEGKRFVYRRDPSVSQHEIGARRRRAAGTRNEKRKQQESEHRNSVSHHVTRERSRRTGWDVLAWPADGTTLLTALYPRSGASRCADFGAR